MNAIKHNRSVYAAIVCAVLLVGAGDARAEPAARSAEAIAGYVNINPQLYRLKQAAIIYARSERQWNFINLMLENARTKARVHAPGRLNLEPELIRLTRIGARITPAGAKRNNWNWQITKIRIAARGH